MALAPTRDILNIQSIPTYSDAFIRMINSNNALEILNGYLSEREVTILMCWEPAGQHCHRRLLAEWFHEKTGYMMLEYSEASAGSDYIAPTRRPRVNRRSQPAQPYYDEGQGAVVDTQGTLWAEGPDGTLRPGISRQIPRPLD
jgi:hypothetical protein